jgi:hypothetical protein
MKRLGEQKVYMLLQIFWSVTPVATGISRPAIPRGGSVTAKLQFLQVCGTENGIRNCSRSASLSWGLGRHRVAVHSAPDC